MAYAFPERLKELRLARGLTQQELADQIVNWSRASVGQWELGGTAPSAEALYALAEAFGVSADELLGRDANAADARREMELLFARLRLDNPIGFIEDFTALPVAEQRILARLVQLSALGHTNKIRPLRRVAEKGTQYESSE